MDRLACPDCGHDIGKHVNQVDDRAGHCASGDLVDVPVRRKDGNGYLKRPARTWRGCHCWRDQNAVAHPENYAPKLNPGDRCRSIRHPELTGTIKHYEHHERGWLSPMPYCVGWDDSSRACALLGWLFVYASDASVEAA